jgi:hypothetical protein
MFPVFHFSGLAETRGRNISVKLFVTHTILLYMPGNNKVQCACVIEINIKIRFWGAMEMHQMYAVAR